MAAVSGTAFAALCVHQGLPMADALVYRAEGQAVLHGTDLYGFTVTEWHLPATYPPFAALLFVPAALVPVTALKAAFLAGNALLLAWLVQLSARLAGLPALPVAVRAGVAALALWLEPVFQTVLFGQINLAIVCLVLWDLTRPPGARARGVAVGIAAGIKLTPAVFIVYLLLRGHRRDALTATAACAGTVLLGALALPAATLDYFTRHLHDTARVGKAWIVDNQSLQGLVARALGDPAPGPAWLLVALPVAAAGLLLVRTAAADHHAVLLTAGTALLVSPISWTHHWVWCVPLLAVLLAQHGPRLAALVAAVFTARTMWLLPHEGDLDLRLPGWQQPLAAPYALLAVALAVALQAAQSSARSSSASTIR
ncbi:glycosyltransferase 87 family protein [Streptomyces sp. NPDC002784]